jgi:hypothetical protein
VPAPPNYRPSLAVGTTFGRLTYVEPIGRNKFHKWMGRFSCVCGGARITVISAVKDGRTVSCGCITPDNIRARCTKHGEAAIGKQTSEYKVWMGMRKRCRNPKEKSYSRYGGRGITVCERWDNFANFLADMGRRPSPAHSLDRIDNDGPYAPGNVRWTIDDEQARNKRETVYVKVDGKQITLAEFCGGSTNAQYQKIHQRMVKLGWSFEKAIQ